MPKLLVKSDYRNRELSYSGGTEIEVDESLKALLMADAPDNFEEKGLDEPVVDKMIDEPEEKKVVKKKKKSK